MTPQTVKLALEAAVYLHPMIVHFPIALLLSAVALDSAGFVLRRPSLTQAGFYLLCLGCAAALAAYLSGGTAKAALVRTPPINTLVHLHQTAALAVVGLSGLLVLIRLWHRAGMQGQSAALYFGGAAVLVAAVSITGWYGGEVVYTHGGGVQAPGVVALLQAQRKAGQAAPSIQNQSHDGEDGGPRVADPTGAAVVNGLWVATILFTFAVAAALLVRWRVLLKRLLGLPQELREYLDSDWSHCWTITRD